MLASKKYGIEQRKRKWLVFVEKRILFFFKSVEYYSDSLTTFSDDQLVHRFCTFEDRTRAEKVLANVLESVYSKHSCTRHYF